jgi:hypothetical protein
VADAILIDPIAPAPNRFQIDGLRCPLSVIPSTFIVRIVETRASARVQIGLRLERMRRTLRINSWPGFLNRGRDHE